MKRRAILSFILPAVLAGTPALAVTNGMADLSSIDNAIAAFTGQQIGVPGGAQFPVDRRLRLAMCRAPLALAWRSDRRDSVVVQCPDAGGWRLFVAVAAAGARQDMSDTAVMRGESVTIAVTGDGFTVSQPGEAVDSGVVGAWIRVRTTAKADPVRARIVRPGLVELPVD